MAKKVINDEIKQEIVETVKEEIVAEKTNDDIIKGIKDLIALVKEVGENQRKNGKANRRHMALATKLNAYITRKVFC